MEFLGACLQFVYIYLMRHYGFTTTKSVKRMWCSMVMVVADARLERESATEVCPRSMGHTSRVQPIIA